MSIVGQPVMFQNPFADPHNPNQQVGGAHIPTGYIVENDEKNPNHQLGAGTVQGRRPGTSPQDGAPPPIGGNPSG